MMPLVTRLVGLVSVTLTALAAAGLAASSSSAGSSPPARTASGFPGAPHPQPGHFAHYHFVCPLAPPSRYLPARSGCVGVFRIDVDGHGRPDLVLLYGDLGHRHYGRGYVPVGYGLEVVRATGAITQTRLGTLDGPPAFIRHGNVNGVPGAELFLRLEEISSGDTYGAYTFHDGRLTRVTRSLSAGGDSIVKEGFSCRAGARPRLISRTMTGIGTRLPGRWRWTVTTYAWHGATLRRIAQRRFVRRGLPSARAIAPGAGCGPIVRGIDGYRPPE
jgi:hypothetical protein